MRKKFTERQKTHQIIIGGLRETIRVHGPITKLLIGSAAKRITGTLLAKKKKYEGLRSDAKEGGSQSRVRGVFSNRTNAEKYIGPQKIKPMIKCTCCGEKRSNPAYNSSEAWRDKLFIKEWLMDDDPGKKWFDRLKRT